MNILILNYEYPPLGGGAGIVTQHLAAEFIDKGHDVTILTTWFAGEPEYHSDRSLTIIRLKSVRKYSYHSNPFEMFDWIQKARSYCRKHLHAGQFDVCLANFTLPGGAVAGFLKDQYQLPFLILSHGHDVPWFSPKQMFFWHLICYPYIKRIMNRAAYNIVLTDQLKEAADQFTGEKGSAKNKVIANGLFPFNLRKGFNSEDSVIRALFVGRLVEQKDPLTVIKAFRKLVNKNIPIHLKIIGDGILKKETEEYISENQVKHIEILGKISQSQVMDEYSRAHILIAPSREEAMSLSVLEALSCGLYVFATNVSGNGELIHDGVNGNFVEYGNADHLSSSIETFYRDKFLKNYQYPDSMMQAMLQYYSWENAAERYLALFNEAISTNSKSS